MKPPLCVLHASLCSHTADVSLGVLVPQIVTGFQIVPKLSDVRPISGQGKSSIDIADVELPRDKMFDDTLSPPLGI